MNKYKVYLGDIIANAIISDDKIIGYGAKTNVVFVEPKRLADLKDIQKSLYCYLVNQDDLDNLEHEINRLNNIIIIMEKYLELIIDLGYDCDGLDKPEDLRNLIDELVRYASLGRAYNTTEVIYTNDNKKYNILHEELKED